MAIKNLYFFLMISCLTGISITASQQIDKQLESPQSEKLRLFSKQTVVLAWQMSAKTIGGQCLEYWYLEYWYKEYTKNSCEYIYQPDEEINSLQLFGQSLYFACVSDVVHQIGSLITIHLLARKRYSQRKSTVLLAAYGVPLVQLEDAVAFFSSSGCYLLWYFFNRKIKEHGVIEKSKAEVMEQLGRSVSNVIIYVMHKGIEKGLNRIKPKWNAKLQQMPYWAQLWTRVISKIIVEASIRPLLFCMFNVKKMNKEDISYGFAS